MYESHEYISGHDFRRVAVQKYSSSGVMGDALGDSEGGITGGFLLRDSREGNISAKFSGFGGAHCFAQLRYLQSSLPGLDTAARRVGLRPPVLRLRVTTQGHHCLLQLLCIVKGH